MRYRSLSLGFSAQCCGLVFILLTSAAPSNGLAAPLSSKPWQQSVAPRNEAAQYLAWATAAFQDNNYGKAGRCLDRALEAASTLSAAEVARAELMNAKVRWYEGNKDGAFDSIGLAIKYADTAEARLFLASMYLYQEKTKSADSEIDLAILDDPANAAAYELRARIAVSRNELDTAIAAYQKALLYTNPTDREYQRLQDRFDAVKEFAAQRFETAHPGYAPPSPTNRPIPEYTKEARGAKIQGVVLTLLQVNEQGTVEHVRVVNGPGYGLDEQAAKAVAQLHFTPAFRDGVAVKAWLRVEVEFNLR